MKAQTVEQTIEIEVSEGRIKKAILESENTKIIFKKYPEGKELELTDSIKNFVLWYFLKNANQKNMDELCEELAGEDKEMLKSIVSQNLNLMTQYLIKLQ